MEEEFSFELVHFSKVKVFLVFIATLSFWYNTQAQGNLGFFVEGGANLIDVNQEIGINAQVSANLLLKKKFYIGAFYERLVSKNADFIPLPNNTPVPVPGPLFDTTQYFNQSTGLKLGFIVLPIRIVSISPEANLGWSNFFWDSARNRKNQYLNISPSLKAQVRFLKVLRFGVSVNYRYYVEIDIDQNIPEFTTNKLGGLGGGVFLRVGKF